MLFFIYFEIYNMILFTFFSHGKITNTRSRFFIFFCVSDITFSRFRLVPPKLLIKFFFFFL